MEKELENLNRLISFKEIKEAKSLLPQNSLALLIFRYILPNYQGTEYSYLSRKSRGRENCPFDNVVTIPKLDKNSAKRKL